MRGNLNNSTETDNYVTIAKCGTKMRDKVIKKGQYLNTFAEFKIVNLYYAKQRAETES